MKPFSWHGIHLDVPAAWDVGALQGGFDKGFARLDDPDMPRLELRWMFSPSRFDIDKALGRYFKLLDKSARKAGGVVEAKIRAGIGPDRRGLESRGFRWKADQVAIGCIVHNPETRRVVIAQGLTTRGEYGDDATTRQALASIHDGADDDGLVTWAVYDFRFRVPADLRLMQHSLKTGAFQLSFDGSRGKIDVYRWALAELLLAKHGGDVVTWWQSGLKRAERRYRDEVAAVEVEGHAAKQVLRHKPFLISAFKKHCVFLWHCPDSNQVLRVDVWPRRKKHWDDLVDAGWSVACHAGEGDD